jgi:ADP-dependent NAD(P)H-hydrate dehydratase / NAD(P)H-hydrate epimerase
MPAVTVSGMLAVEASAIVNGWTEERLLDLAGERLGLALGRYFPHPGTVIAYLGKGHNAGDALVALRILRDRLGWKIATRHAYPIELCAPLTCKKWLELGLESPLASRPIAHDLAGPLILLDGLLGTGSAGALRNPLLALAGEMEWLRQHAGARVAAVDLPSGINADSGEASDGSVTADITFMIGNAKRGILAGHAANSTGALAVVPIEVLSSLESCDMDAISPQTMEFAKCRRAFDFHKGMAGRVAVIAGSTRYPGAAVLAATGALRGGAGLITLHVPVEALALIASKCPPEIIIRGFSSIRELHGLECDSMVVGCGIGELEARESDHLLELIATSPNPLVIDADALNLMARRQMTGILKDTHTITPHPGEFRRLAPDLASSPRETAARKFTDRFPATLLLKGSRTIVTRHGHPLWCNTTGSPGMATGGQGDLLAGVISARLATGAPPTEAAALAAWVCGSSSPPRRGGSGLAGADADGLLQSHRLNRK